MDILNRFISYVKIHSASVEDTDCVPSHRREFAMSEHLVKELAEIGLSNVYGDDHAYVYGSIPATPGLENLPCVAFIAHIDTIPEFSGENVRPQILPDYDGTDVKLGSSGRILSVTDFPHLKKLKGQTLITTDGTTVLGADDKAGVTAIVSACQRIIEEGIPHGKIAVCFTPDEEIGHGAALLDLQRLGADFAFTVDGDELDEINFETFNAAAAHWDINGVSVHPGSAKGHMINASLVAMEINSMLPAQEVPAMTENYEGFFHLTEMKGDVSYATLDYIVRDHDRGAFEERKELLCHVEERVNEKYGAGTAVLTLKEQYRNMAEVIEKDMRPVELAEKAIRAIGLEPKRVPVRGGTDGAQLSFRGLPCPNLGTGAYCFHGPYEHVTLEAMERCTELVIQIVRENAGK